MTTTASSSFDTLPSELISRIFFDLSSDSPGEIAACRLVSHGFKTHSSPFLLPCNIFSRQLGQLTKLREVLKHPYFRQYVTRLVYDASEYAESTALDWDQYVDDCARAPRCLEHTETTDQTRRDIITWEGLNPFKDHTLTTAAGLDVPHNIAFRLGCYTTFGRYMQCLVDQQRIRRENIDESILAAAFIQFPRLRNIIFTDYRGLARDGESYDICCRRLFGRSLEPQHAGISGQTAPSGEDIFSLLRIVARVPTAHIDTLAIGPHAFEYTGEDMSELVDPNHPQNPQYLDISAFEDFPLESNNELVRVLGQLKHLRLVLCYSGCRSDEQHMREQLRKFLTASSPRLQTLTLHLIFLFWGGLRPAKTYYTRPRRRRWKQLVLTS